MGILRMQCSNRVSAHVEVEVVWSTHGGPAVVDGGNREWGGKLRVLAIKRVVAGAAVVAAVVLGVAMGIVLLVVVFYLHLVAVVVTVVAASLG